MALLAGVVVAMIADQHRSHLAALIREAPADPNEHRRIVTSVGITARSYDAVYPGRLGGISEPIRVFQRWRYDAGALEAWLPECWWLRSDNMTGPVYEGRFGDEMNPYDLNDVARRRNVLQESINESRQQVRERITRRLDELAAQDARWRAEQGRTCAWPIGCENRPAAHGPFCGPHELDWRVTQQLAREAREHRARADVERLARSVKRRTRRAKPVVLPEERSIMVRRGK